MGNRCCRHKAEPRKGAGNVCLDSRHYRFTLRTFSFTVCFFLILLPGWALAHDFYLLPERFSLARGETVRIQRYIDDNFPATAANWDPGHVAAFHIVSRRGSVDAKDSLKVVGRSRSAAEIRLAEEGTYLLTYVSRSNTITIEAKKFNDYLKEEGLERILELRQRNGQIDQAGREQYTRFAKVLLQVGPNTDETFRRPTGLRLEIIPEENPTTVKAGQKLAAKILFDGKPLAGALVSAKFGGSVARPAYGQDTRTDKQGRVSFSIDEAGPWLICLTHMEPASSPAAVDWESFWASLTFAK